MCIYTFTKRVIIKLVRPIITSYSIIYMVIELTLISYNYNMIIYLCKVW